MLSQHLLQIVNECVDLQGYYTEREDTLRSWQKNIDALVSLYYRLEDEESRQILAKVLRFYMVKHMAGSGKCPDVSFHSAEEWKNLEGEASAIYPELQTFLMDKLETFVLEGYRYKDIVRADKGDCVLDCGAFTGVTALYFSKVVGSEGKCYAFEASPEIHEILNKNIANYGLDNVLPRNFAITDTSKELAFSAGMSPGSKIVNDGNGVRVQGISIDEFVEREGLAKIDFIKMDIEGAEPDALRGSVATIRRFRPNLAICLYHNPDDFTVIPEIILNIDRNYRFYLKHNSNNFFETVLFAKHEATEKTVDVDSKERLLCAKIFTTYMNMYNKNLATVLKRNIDYFKRFLDAYNRNAKYIFETFGSDNYVALAVSEDKDLHYKVVLRENAARVCLRFEGQWTNLRNLVELQELQFNNQECILLNYDGGYEIAYVFSEVPQAEYISEVMTFLVSKTLPILQRNNCVANVVCNG